MFREEELKWGLEELGPHPVVCAGVEQRAGPARWVVGANTAAQSSLHCPPSLTGLGQLAFLAFCVFLCPPPPVFLTIPVSLVLFPNPQPHLVVSFLPWQLEMSC